MAFRQSRCAPISCRACNAELICATRRRTPRSMRRPAMAIRKLLLPLTGTAAGEAALSTSLMIARSWNAHVLALHVRVDSRDVAPLAGEGLSGAMIEEMMSATEKESSDR